jgi:hypothetical protein
MGAVYRHITTAMEARIIQLLDTRLAEAVAAVGTLTDGTTDGTRAFHRSWRPPPSTVCPAHGSRDPRRFAGSRSAFPCLYWLGTRAEPIGEDCDGP